MTSAKGDNDTGPKRERVRQVKRCGGRERGGEGTERV